MFRHLLVAALRNMAANRLTAAIAMLGLSVGITAAILMALVVRNQLSFDHFIPGHERTFAAVSVSEVPGRATNYSRNSNRGVAALLRLNVPEVEAVTRLILSDKDVFRSGVELRRGEVVARETAYWADPNVFEVLPLPVHGGDLDTALRRSDGIVLPRAMARKYFGRDDAVGQTILVDGHPMTVRAVIEDLPLNGTQLQSGIFASGLAPFSALALEKPDGPGNFSSTVLTYLRLKPGADGAAVERRLQALIEPMLRLDAGTSYTMSLLRLDRVNLFEGLYPGAWTRVAVAGAVGFLILVIAALNFVNLLTARATRRALEVGVRKACGADRADLIAQFLGESILTVLLAACAAVAAAEFLLPPLNGFLGTGAVFDYWRDPLLLVALLLSVLLVGVTAGAYPAFVLSAFRPSGILKPARSGGAGNMRNLLVIVQFAILVTLTITALVVWQQRRYATEEALRADIANVLMVRGGCQSPAFLAELRKLPGVARASCSGIELLDNSNSTSIAFRGREVTLNNVDAALGIFAVYGIRPVAGTLPAQGDYDPQAARGLVVNEAAVRRLGIASPQAAIGQPIPQPGEAKAPPMTIAAVVPDFAFYSVERPLEPTAYVPQRSMDVASIKLREGEVAPTLAAIDRLWTATGNNGPVTRFLVTERMEAQYFAMTRAAQLLAVFVGVAIFLACLGLFGLSIAASERRIREIGVRKAMGAANVHIVRMLLWQFARPMLLANLAAWPLAWYLMQRWLAGFAYHVPLSPWPFLIATTLAVLVGLMTVMTRAVATARTLPAMALRYD